MMENRSDFAATLVNALNLPQFRGNFFKLLVTSANWVKSSGSVRKKWKSESMMFTMRAMKTYPSAQTFGFARWTKKIAEVHYRYRNHVKAAAQSKLIEHNAVTDASVRDWQNKLCG
jgi:hypothetical protein